MQIHEKSLNEIRPYKNNPRKNDAAVGPVAESIKAFGGSGSTLIACEQLQRRCYTMEFDPLYADVIIKRWEQLTGRKAKLLEE